MRLFEFEDLIKEYTVPFMIQYPVIVDPKTVERDNLGKEIKPEPLPPVPAEGALIPFAQRVIYQSGGRLTESDRTLYSLDHDIPKKAKIFHDGLTYHVESKTPYKPYADFAVYTLKAVSAFD